jgi:hypothetical protein
MDAYYTVPLMAANQKENSMVQGAVLYDAYSGQFREMSVVEDPVSYIMLDNRDYALKTFYSKFDPQGKSVRQLTAFELAWEPSEQSRSPYHPLWQAKGTTAYSKTPVVLAYMSQSGELTKTLTPLAESKLKGGSK